MTISELYIVFEPINRRRQEPYSLRRVKDQIRESSWMFPVINVAGEKYSPDDYRKFLKEGNIPFDEEISNRLLVVFNNSSEERPQELKEKMKRLRRRIKRERALKANKKE